MPSSSKSNVCFFFQTPVSITNRTALKTFIQSSFRREGRKLAFINYIFTDDKRLLAINREYLAHDDYTDIISFELSPPGMPAEAEIYISVTRVRENAQKLGHSLRAELHRVIFHGALHICGYKDKSAADIKIMRDKEDEWLKRYGIVSR